MSEAVNAHYDDSYFSWQESIGRFGGTANLLKFQSLIKPTDNVVDFGSGGGFLLNSLNCAGKMGIEVNPNALTTAARLGIKTVSSFDDVPDNFADVVISNHALEHTDYPLSHLQSAFKKLKPGGRIIFVVPCENIGYSWKKDDINFHLHSWSPMCLGNLFVRAGFEIEEVKPYFHKWPPKYYFIQKVLGWPLYHMVCRVYSHLARNWFQVRCVARKPA